MRKNSAKTSVEQLQSDFVSLSSHQLRTPLSAIKWFTEILLKQRTGKLNRKQIDYLREIQNSTERAIALVNDLLQVSRVQEGKLHLDLTTIDFAALASEIIELYRSKFESGKISVNFEVLHGPLPQVHADKIKLKRVFENVLANAIHYTPTNGSVDIKLKRNDGEILCSIIDTGVGIPQDQQNTVFTKFFRATNAAKIQPDGTGLGLFIARALLSAHGGKIWFESSEGTGTTFFFTVPLKPSKPR